MKKFMVVLDDQQATALMWACLAGVKLLSEEAPPLSGRKEMMEALSSTYQVIEMATQGGKP